MTLVSKILRIWPALKLACYPFWNRLYARICGVKFGHNMLVHNKIYIYNKGSISIGDDFHFTSGDCINPISRNLRGSFYTMVQGARIEIGSRVGISSSCIWAKDMIKIGNDVNIGGDCIIMDNDAHPIDYMHRRRELFNQTIGTSPILIEDDVWIGARCIILKGVQVGARSIIAAGSVVTHSIPSDVLAAGNPCKVIKSLL